MNRPLSPKRLKWTLFGVLFVFLCTELVFQGHAPNAVISLMQGAVVAFVALWWLIADSRQRQFPVSPLFKVGVVAISGIFIPVYLIRSRGIRAAAKSIGVFALQRFGLMLAASLLLGILSKLGVVSMNKMAP